MRLLLDTPIAVWWIEGDRRLGRATKAEIEDDHNDAFVSAASVWEIAIKFARAKGRADDMPLSGQQALAEFGRAGVGLLPVTPEHAAAVDDLPPLHGDPFDRMLIAQATIEGLRLLTRDARLKAYGAMVIVG